MFSFCVPRIAAAPSHTVVPGAIRHRVQLWTPPAPGPETKPCLAPDSGPEEVLDLGLTHTTPATLCAPHNGAPKTRPQPGPRNLPRLGPQTWLWQGPRIESETGTSCGAPNLNGSHKFFQTNRTQNVKKNP